MISFVLPIPPSVNSYLKKSVIYTIGKYGKREPKVHVYKSAEAIAFLRTSKKRIEEALSKTEWEQAGEFQYVFCDLVAYISHKKVDCDNLLKCTLDAIKECSIVYDDSMIIPRFKDVFIDSKNPRLEIKISKANKVGIFKNLKEFNSFKEANCLLCKKYKTYGERCSIIQSSIQNKITENVDMEELKCLKMKAKS